MQYMSHLQATGNFTLNKSHPPPSGSLSLHLQRENYQALNGSLDYAIDDKSACTR